jgi:Restriction alleviation protein Lar
MSNRDQYLQTPRPYVDDRLRDAAPCPFCGSRALSFSRMGNYVHCKRCGADGPEVPYQRDREYIWRIALESWNLRPR